MADTSRIEDLKRRVQSDPASIAFAALAEEYRRAGQYEEAIAACRAGLQRHPAYLSARVTLGRALLEVSSYDEARQELEYVLTLAPENLAAVRALAEIHHRRGELPEEAPYKAALEAAHRDTHAEHAHAPQAHAPQAHAPQAHVPQAHAPQVSVHTAQGKSADIPATAAGAPAALTPTQATRPVIQPVRVQPSAAAPAPAPAADPALASLEGFLTAILRAKQDLESAPLRS